jgi:hypothetical protein
LFVIGRYRNPALFIGDLKYAIEGRIVKKLHALIKAQKLQEQSVEQRDKVNQCAALLMRFLSTELEPKLILR